MSCAVRDNHVFAIRVGRRREADFEVFDGLFDPSYAIFVVFFLTAYLVHMALDGSKLVLDLAQIVFHAVEAPFEFTHFNGRVILDDENAKQTKHCCPPFRQSQYTPYSPAL